MSDTITEWTTGTTWSLRKHAIRPETSIRPEFYSGPPTAPAVCNQSYWLYLDSADHQRLPDHIRRGRDSAKACKRCETIVARETGRTLAEIAGVR
ncbi:hypothetical protein GS466_24935 [Rhodococcus hoagii]|nr:hypothetical protein [Prescottella equi]